MKGKKNLSKKDILRRELSKTKEEMDTVRNRFEWSDNRILSEHYMYRLKAAEARYHYFAEKLKNETED